MIRRQHQKGDAASYADYSADEAYRYLLVRIWAPGARARDPPCTPHAPDWRALSETQKKPSTPSRDDGVEHR